jgi:hypothetical protein
MLTDLLIWTFTALTLVVVVVTRLRLRGETAGGRTVSTLTLNAHTCFGLLAFVLWVVFLVAPDDSVFGGSLVGIVAVGCWWVSAGLGLVLLSRWRRSRGRHSGGDVDEAPRWAFALSVLGHVGLFLTVIWFTWLYLVSAV